MNTNPNAIIRALLDIAQAAYVLIHSPSKAMADNLKEKMEVIEGLPQYCNNPVNSAARASYYLQSFLVGGSELTTVSADVQRDGIEFHTQPWQAPAIKHGTDDIGALREQAEAWQAVSGALHQHVPEWSKLSTRAMDSAVLTIADLAKKRGATILHHMLADKTDEAMRIINDAELLKNFVELFTMRDPGVTMLKVYEAAHCDNSMPWNISVYVENKSMRNYRSTSLHQAIVKAHKSEQDHEYPEPDAPKPAPTWDMSASMPMPIMPAAAVVGISTAPAEPTITDSPRRQEMIALLLKVRDDKSIALAKRIVSEVAKVTKMSDIADDKIEDVIRACEMELKK